MGGVDPGRLPADLVEGLGVQSAHQVNGGDIARAYRLETRAGPLFLKTLDQPPEAMFESEAVGLRALRRHAPAPLRVPEVVRASASGLVLEWIDQTGGSRSRSGERALGRALAGLHRTTNEHFGGLDGAGGGYLGAVRVELTPTSTWPQFYLRHRLEPLVGEAISRGRLDPGAADILDHLGERAQELCGPPEPPALLHGDLWAGNRVVDARAVNWLIDPSCHWGHREYDLAMMRLFGGFGDDCFAAYDQAWPLAQGWRERVEWYQVAPLLVHAILFGGHYGQAALSALRRYA